MHIQRDDDRGDLPPRAAPARRRYLLRVASWVCRLMSARWRNQPRRAGLDTVRPVLGSTIRSSGETFDRRIALRDPVAHSSR